MLQDMESQRSCLACLRCSPEFLQVLDVLGERGGEVDSKEERWNASSTPLLAPQKWQDVKEEEAVLCMLVVSKD